MTKPKPAIPNLETFDVLTIHGEAVIAAQRAVIDGGVLSFLVEGLVVAAYAPGRWLTVYRARDFSGK